MEHNNALTIHNAQMSRDTVGFFFLQTAATVDVGFY